LEEVVFLVKVRTVSPFVRIMADARCCVSLFDENLVEMLIPAAFKA